MGIRNIEKLLPSERHALNKILEKKVSDLTGSEHLKLMEKCSLEKKDKVSYFLNCQWDEIRCLTHRFDRVFLPMYADSYKNFVDSKEVTFQCGAQDRIWSERLEYRTFKLNGKREMILPVNCCSFIKDEMPFVIEIKESDDPDVADCELQVRHNHGFPEKKASDILNIIEKDVWKKNVLQGGFFNGNFELNDRPELGWSEIILGQSVHNEIKMNIIDILERYKLYEKFNIPMRRGIIIHGPTGVGKTLIGKLLVSKLKSATFIWITPKDIISPNDVANLYRRARKLKPSIIFLEDAEVFMSDRIYGEITCPPILGEFLVQLDGLVENHGVITIITTNHPDMLEKAIKDRPGRFDCRIPLKSPDLDARRKMLGLFFRDFQVDSTDLELLASDSEGLTGAQLKELSIRSLMISVETMDNGAEKPEISKESLKKALALLKKPEKEIGFVPVVARSQKNAGL